MKGHHKKNKHLPNHVLDCKVDIKADFSAVIFEKYSQWGSCILNQTSYF